MIRLIASDLDGTLLLGDASLPTDVFSVIEALYEKNILFCVASGRQYAGLTRLFAPVADKILFIAENGALVSHRGKTLFRENVPFAALPDILNAVRSQPNAHPLLCCENYAYAWDSYPPFLAECKKYYPNFRLISNPNEAPMSDSICKIAVFDDRGSAEFSGKTLPHLLPDFRVIVSGKVWSDISLKQTDKGRALKQAQNLLNIPPEDCMAFGDYMNDYEMLLACKHSFVPENGFPLLIEKIGKTVPPNTQNGVLEKIKEVLNEQ